MPGDSETRTIARRSSDTVINLLSDRINGVQDDTRHIAASLQSHVTECAKLQKKVLLVLVFVAGWVVSHSPEAGELAIKIVKIFA